MTLGEFRTITADTSDDADLEVYIPYQAVMTESGRGKPESGSIVKTVEHVTTKMIDGIVILTTDVTTKKAFVKASKEETECDVS